MKPKQFYKKKASDNWPMYRLVMSEKFSFTEVSAMDLDTLLEANAALDIHLAEENKRNKKK
ncbi:hypothetical protein QTN46_14535 [Bacillus amyloliquefaciens]|uniref:hypothetical protein n=1 Tax=Bacillus amyloliquefaciens TaxID=1390 RepID=UPI0025A110EB|nr:hypothetical protein [Bacillus amyloliquefaciens]WJM60705.1 hypothetical protein QTN46_14535 [Bacillus amyloliquefaciens]